MTKVLIHTDGGARGNPGPAGAGWTIEVDPKAPQGGARASKKTGAKFLGEQTNNFAEYEAIILALSDLKKLVPKDKRKNAKIELRLDSELAARQLEGRYQVKDEPLQLQYMKIHNLRVSEFPNISFTHIPREQNSEADALANEAMNSGHSGNLF